MKWSVILAWRIEFTGEARKQLKKLGHTEAKCIHDYLHQRIDPLGDPRQIGKSLKGRLSNLWRYRVGNYRLVCELRDEVLVVLIVRIWNRKEIYH
jgi:mRNA interferase RelE/StbE